jgi:hypothetical protein
MPAEWEAHRGTWRAFHHLTFQPGRCQKKFLATRMREAIADPMHRDST